MQIQIFNLVYNTFRKLGLSDEISKINENDLRENRPLLSQPWGHQKLLKLALASPSWVPITHKPLQSSTWELHLSSAQGLELCLFPRQTLGQGHPTLVLSPSAPSWGPIQTLGLVHHLPCLGLLMDLHNLGTLESCLPRQFNLFRIESWWSSMTFPVDSQLSSQSSIFRWFRPTPRWD